jgi:hypothetical protein
VEVLPEDIGERMRFAVRSGAHQGDGRFMARQFEEELNAGDGSQKNQKQDVFHLFAGNWNTLSC